MNNSGLSRKILIIIIFSFLFARAVFSQDNPIYSNISGKPVSTHWMFAQYSDSVTGYWSQLQSLPQQLYGVNAYYYSANNKVFICGGITQQGAPQSNCYWYNIAANSYEPAVSLPHGRWSGKLVRVRDSLYLVGSVDSTFNSADGLIFKYSLSQNTWVISDTMPQPYLHECAAAVINDSLIVTIGGSTGTFGNAVNYVRVFNPWNGNWTASPSGFPVNNATSHAECLKIDTAYNIIVVGGYGAGPLNTVFKGVVTLNLYDSLRISWRQIDTLNSELFGQAIYRVAGAKWNDYAVFGPGMNGVNSVNKMWGIKFYNDTNFVWLRFDPGSPDSAGNISTFAVKSGADTNYFFLFGGYKNPNVVSSAGRFTFAAPPPPIGIINTGGSLPKSFLLKQNYPNPFNPVTVIEFNVPVHTRVSLKVYDALGRLVKVLVDETLSPGNYKTSFNGENFASGIYYYIISSEDYRLTKKMIILK